MVLPLEINTQQNSKKCNNYFFITAPKLTNICEIIFKFQTTHITCYDDSKLYHHIFSVRSMSLGFFSISEYFPLQIINSLHVSVSHS